MTEWIEVAKIDDIGPGGLTVRVGEEEVLLVRDGDKVYALAGLCSHQEMELQGGHVEGGAWVCPHHGAKFDLSTGDALSMPAIEAISVFDVRVEAGKVSVLIR
ncbi:MAG: Rieske 2Fe-2S domain-containing protein [Acidobacteria bacterium]|nr:Rieske 2Fe-2S domain-containing protein [Acidobacteriota bacterium]